MTVTLIGRTGFEVDAIDVFCGFGGSSQGIHAAGATVLAAANHSALALECHAANFPDTEHWQADMVSSSDPKVLDRKGKKVDGRYLDPADLPRARFAWFSPACTHHSLANSKKVYERGLQQAMWEDDDWDEQAFVNSERSRVTMSCVLRYVDSAHPEIVCVENVIEVSKWGPGRDGSSFRWWLGELDKLGYDYRLNWLNSMFFGPCPQSRDRLYVVAWRKGNVAPDLDYRPTAFCASDECGGKIVQARQSWKRRASAWMSDTWGKYGGQYLYTCPDCRRPVDPASWMAITAIDWSNLGPTLEEKIAAGDRPAENTWERIRRAYSKYRNAPPVILPSAAVGAAQVTVTHGKNDGDRSRHITEEMSTLAAKNGVAVAIVSNYGADQGLDRSTPGTSPLGAVTVRGTQQSVLALTVKNNGDASEVGYRGHHISQPLGSITASPTQSILALIVPNRTHNVGTHASDPLAPVMAGTVSQAVVVAAAGNTSERPRQTRARHGAEPLFTQTATGEYGLAAMPVLRGDHPEENHVGEQIRTVSAAGTHHALVTGMFSKINGGPGDTAWHGMDEPLNTVTSRDTHGLVIVPWIDQWHSDPIGITEQLATITTRLRHSLASIEPSDEPITDEMMLQVRFRMLEPDPELRRVMAFGDDYILLGNKTQMTAGLGNAVTPPVASWITEQCMASLRGAA